MPPGRTPSVAYEDVARVCEDLTGRGALTLDNVRTELGRGSKTTLLAHYQAWRAQRAERAQAPATEALPEGLRAAWAQGLAQVRTELHDEFRVQIEELRRQLSFAQESLQQSEGRAETLEAELGESRAAAAQAQLQTDTQLAELRGKLSESDRQVEALRKDLAREQEGAENARIGAAEANIRAGAAQTSIATLGDENKELRQALEGLRTQVAGASQAAAVAEAHLKDRDASVTLLTKDLHAARQELQAMRAEHLTQMQRAQDAERRAEVCEAKSVALHERLQHLDPERAGKPAGPGESAPKQGKQENT